MNERSEANRQAIAALRKARRAYPNAAVNNETVDLLVDALEAAEAAIEASSPNFGNLEDALRWLDEPGASLRDDVRKDILVRLAQHASHLAGEERGEIASWASREVSDDVDRKSAELRFETDDLPDATDIDGNVIPGLLSCSWCSHPQELHKQIPGCISEGCSCGAGPKPFDRDSRSVSDD